MQLLEPFDIYLPVGRIKFLDKTFNVAKAPAFSSVIIRLNGTGKWIRMMKGGEHNDH